MKRILSAVLLLSLAAFQGCESSMGYITIPRDSADVAQNNANTSTVRELYVVAMRKTLERFPVEGTKITFRLPEGATYATYLAVAESLGDPFAFLADAPEGAPVFEVKEIRVRGANGYVMVVHPGGVRPVEVAEVTVHYEIDGMGMAWNAQGVLPRSFSAEYTTHPVPLSEEQNPSNQQEPSFAE